ncbi:hypothetical protein ABT237_36820 [Streptomyces sp. NPDC001581]|uniref:hypothetical protein n=1 Tax=Streptomyces sp. NPDC001581 TaxID=3154386 RepID=UPI003329D22E
MNSPSTAVRRAAQRRLTGREEELGEDAEKMAPGWSAGQLRGHLGDDILAVLMQGADWPRMARQLVGLQQAGVGLAVFLLRPALAPPPPHHRGPRRAGPGRGRRPGPPTAGRPGQGRGTRPVGAGEGERW